MVCIWDSDYMGNPGNAHYLTIAHSLGLDYEKEWKNCREFYLSLDPEVKREFDSFIYSVQSIKIGQELRDLLSLQKSMNERSSIDITTGSFGFAY
jgi:hypothetical protein